MKRLLVILLALGLACPAVTIAAPPDQGCRSCHQAMTSPMPPPGKGAPLSCLNCHQGQGRSRDKDQAHEGLLANPSTLDAAGQTCGRCHQGRAAQVRRSPMATNATLIAQTRFLWSAQPNAAPRHGIKAEGRLAAMPPAGEAGQPVDDLLRRRCLRCHVWAKGADTTGARRSAGCAACHRPYGADGRRPGGHGLTRQVPTSQCLTCHAGCGAGPEYVGRVPRDEHFSARFLAEGRDKPSLWQARTWRPMRPDLHHKAGMACIDCHPAAEIMGDGQVRPAALAHVGLRCTTCHGRPGAPPAGPKISTTHGAALTHLSRSADGQWTLSPKLGGRPLKVPALAGGPDAPIAHLAPGHERLACHACHSSTNPAQWGRQALLLSGPGYRRWSFIAAQGDPQLLALMKNQPPAPSSRDLLSGQERPGVWLLSPFFRRFEWRVYGRAPDGRVMLLAPRFGWVLTPNAASQARLLTAGDGRPALGISPWHSHSTAKATVGCQGCHGGAMEAGLGLTFVVDQPAGQPLRLAPPLWRPDAEGLSRGLDWTRVVDLAGRPSQVFLNPGARPFNEAEIKRLLTPTKLYKRWLLKALERSWPGSGAQQAHDGEGRPGR